ncbi:MAG: CaiB/BaiF CoA transferase family protein [Acidimicrobiales bacterium]
MSQPLAGVRVIELATEVAGPYAGKLLADYGADVIKVEPPGGDPARRHGPFPAGPGGDPEPDPEQSALFLHLNANKRSVVADLGRNADRDLVADLIAGADVVIESFAPGCLAEIGLDPGELRARHRRLVVTSLTPFGQTGPYARRIGADIVTYAMGGPMNATGIQGRPPLKLGGNVTSYQCGNLAATATLAGLMVAEQTGDGVHVDLSHFEAQAASIDRRTTYYLSYLWDQRVPEREAPATVRTLPAGFFPTMDGHVLVYTIQPWIERMLTVLGDDDGELRRRFDQPGWPNDDELTDLVQATLYQWLFEGDAVDRTTRAQSVKWPVTPLLAPVDVLDDVHLAERKWLVTVEHPAAGPVVQPGPPFRIDDGWDLRRPAPMLDEHGPEIRAAFAGAGPAGAPADPARAATAPTAETPSSTVVVGGDRLPLEGVRVLDLTVVWAGPACTMHLGDLGAEVIRVDNPWVFPTATRGATPRPEPHQSVTAGPLATYAPADVAGPEPYRPWNAQGMYSAHARNKLSCTLDLSRPDGRDMFLRLAAHADVVVENNSVPTLDKLGIGWDALHAANPRLILVRLPPVGLSGPHADYLGFGASFEAMSGLTAIRGYRDDDPSSLTAAFHMDPTSGATGAFATMLALRRRGRTGEGELVEVAQNENMMQHIGEYFVDAARTGCRHEAAGNRHVSYAPQGAYPCADDGGAGGDDRWMVLSVADDDQWLGLCRAIGRADLADDPRLATAAGRRANHDELDAAITAWTAGRDRFAAVDACQAEGVPSGPVLDEADLVDDPHLADRGFYRPQGSYDIGTWDFPGHQWRWTGPPMRWGPVCRMGADNDYVYRQVLGLDDAEYAALDAAGHLSMDYLRPDGTPF